MNEADNMMNSLAFFIRHDHHDPITETLSLFLFFIYSLFIGSLFSLDEFGHSAMTSGKLWEFWKAETQVYYLQFI